MIYKLPADLFILARKIRHNGRKNVIAPGQHSPAFTPHEI